MKIILIGYRAAGKSTVGSILSKKLKIPFVDSDQIIVEETGMPIKEFVTRHGWEAFREKETKVIASIYNMNPCVVATGGGAVMAAGNRELLKNSGTLVYLKTPLRDIVERLRRDAHSDQTRPQFTTESLEEETMAVLEERIPVYESIADFTVDTDGKNVKQVSDDVYQYLFNTGIVSEIKKLKKRFIRNQ
ncbi:MAG: shikimate kinase I [Deltaproteobacteria bacterium HGW-Deltaproteobacteria-1]|jgi:shikimate kinase|nr:MAG: shikimate kinase I [Deltaproteobacteria bacterium HGW-Deltaproteobacteria-1]